MGFGCCLCGGGVFEKRIMKYLRQFFIILIASFLGEGVKALIPLTIPASVYGLVFLFLLLHFGVVKLEQVKETADFLIEIMPVMFLPAAVGLMDSWGALEPMVFPVLLVTVVVTILVMVVSGRVTQWIIVIKDGGRKS